jgi:hypothetical protein
VKTPRCLLVCLFSLPGLLGCHSDRPEAVPPAPGADRAAVAVGRIVVRDETPPDTRPVVVEVAALEARLRRALVAGGIIDRPPAGADWAATARARVVYGVGADGGLRADAGPGTVAARWQVEVQLRVPGEPSATELVFDGRDEAPYDGVAATLPGALDARLEAALAGLGPQVAKRLDVVTRDDTGLIGALADADPERRRWAIDRLATRRVARSVPALAERLGRESDRETTLRLVGALAELADDRAAPALIARADTKDRELLQAIVDALASVGGAPVEPFFAVLAEHDAPEIREMVARARQRLRQGRHP